MPTVDSKGRILIPKKIRERLGITPGMEVEVREENGNVIVEPEEAPEEILERMGRLVAETSADRGETTSPANSPDSAPRDHRAAVRRGAKRDDDA